FFFFQAEDGIRDLIVTGVQTCALPISAISGLSSIDDAKASQQLASMMRDPDVSVAQTAISSSYNGGPEVDTTLSQIVNDPNAAEIGRASCRERVEVGGGGV